MIYCGRNANLLVGKRPPEDLTNKIREGER
jgi:hypothetical protein